MRAPNATMGDSAKPVSFVRLSEDLGEVTFKNFAAETGEADSHKFKVYEVELSKKLSGLGVISHFILEFNEPAEVFTFGERLIEFLRSQRLTKKFVDDKDLYISHGYHPTDSYVVKLSPNISCISVLVS